MVEESLLFGHAPGEVGNAGFVGGVRVGVVDHPSVVVDPDVVAVLQKRTREHAWKGKTSHFHSGTLDPHLRN